MTPLSRFIQTTTASRRRRKAAVAAVCLAAAAWHGSVLADALYVGSSGNWNVPAAWSPVVEPLADTGLIHLQQTIKGDDVILTFSPTGGTVTANVLGIWTTNGGSITLFQFANMLTSTEERIGTSGGQGGHVQG